VVPKEGVLVATDSGVNLPNIVKEKTFQELEKNFFIRKKKTF
jgi:hypothetical protein